jgi:hypothetical protein
VYIFCLKKFYFENLSPPIFIYPDIDSPFASSIAFPFTLDGAKAAVDGG